jgi:hypothetical protein
VLAKMSGVQFNFFCSFLIFMNVIHRSSAEHYVVMAVTSGSPDAFISSFKPTLQFYLTQQVSLELGRPVSFELRAVSINADQNSIFDYVESKTVDFVFASPYLMGCLESEFDIQILVTLRRKYIVSGKAVVINR